MGQALEAATALAGFTGNPAIIQLVQAAVVGVWAFVESVLDIRLLLEGGKVPVVKNGAQWTSDLFCLGQYVSPKVRAKNGDDGMTPTRITFGGCWRCCPRKSWDFAPVM